MKVIAGEMAEPETPHPLDRNRFIAWFDFDQIFCDGEEVKHVYAFADVEGWLDFYPMDGEGRPIVEPGEERVKMEHRDGEITYTLRLG